MGEKGTKKEKTIVGLFFGPRTRQSRLLLAGEGLASFFPILVKKES